jgi:hypothetical protein
MKIYITRGEQKAGPYNLAQINAFLNIGRLNLEDKAWFEGCNGWIKVRGVPGVKMLNPSDARTQPERPTTPAPINPPMTQAPPVITDFSHDSAHKSILPSRQQSHASRPAAQFVYKTRIPCRICESGELVKNRLNRFSLSIRLVGSILMFLSQISLGALVLAFIPLDLSSAGTSILFIKKTIVDSWQFLILFSMGGIILSVLFHSKKQVLQCDHCESVVAIE